MGPQSGYPTDFQNRTGVSNTKVRRVSDGIFTRWPEVTTSAPVPAAPPAAAPTTAPLSAAGNRANNGSQGRRAAGNLRGALSARGTLAADGPGIDVDHSPIHLDGGQVQSGPRTPCELARLLRIDQLNHHVRPRGITVWLLTATGSSRLAANVWPTRLTSESTPSIMRTTRFVPVGNSTPAVSRASGASDGRVGEGPG